MDHNKFRLILECAINGDKNAIEKILMMYAPLINKNAYINGVLDEDMKQYLLMHIIKNIKKFKI